MRLSARKVQGKQLKHEVDKQKQCRGLKEQSVKLYSGFQIDDTASQVKRNRVNQTTFEVRKCLPLSGNKIHYQSKAVGRASKHGQPAVVRGTSLSHA